MKVKQRRSNGWRRLFLMPLLLPTVLLLVLADGLVTHAASPDQSLSFVGPKEHYLALGDSNAFGFQPSGNFKHGYVTDLFRLLQREGVKDVTNLACANGETSVTFIHGSVCSYSPYPSQLEAAVAFLHTHAGEVSPVTLEIGANDIQGNLDRSTCAVNVEQFNADLARLDSNLKDIILPTLREALTVNGQVTGSIVMNNLYNPYQNICPNSVPYVKIVNQHLADDVSGFGIIVDAFDAIGGAETPNPKLCTYTWICSHYQDGHLKNNGYRVVANTMEDALDNALTDPGVKS